MRSSLVFFLSSLLLLSPLAEPGEASSALPMKKVTTFAKLDFRKGLADWSTLRGTPTVLQADGQPFVRLAPKQSLTRGGPVPRGFGDADV